MPSYAPDVVYVCPSDYCRATSPLPGLCPWRNDYNRHHEDKQAPMVEYRRADGGGQRCFVCGRVNDGGQEFVPLSERYREPARYGNNGLHLCPEHADFEERVERRREKEGEEA